MAIYRSNIQPKKKRKPRPPAESRADAHRMLCLEKIFAAHQYITEYIAASGESNCESLTVDDLFGLLKHSGRDLKFTLRICEMLPAEYKQEVLLKIVNYFDSNPQQSRHAYNLQFNRRHVADKSEFYRQTLVRFVLNQNEDAFFLLIKDLDTSEFYFGLKEMTFLNDYSEYDNGPGPHPGHLHDANAPFLEFVMGCGTDRMKHWAETIVDELFKNQRIYKHE